MKPSADAIARLRVVQKQIILSPKFYEQNEIAKYSPCGTTCCIAGWLDYNEFAREHNQRAKYGLECAIMRSAKQLLGFAVDEYVNLFDHSEGWPAPFNREYRHAKTPLARAQVAVRRIDHFIETGEISHD